MTKRLSPKAQLEHSGRLWFREAMTEEDLAACDAAWDLGARPGARLGTSGPLAMVLAPGGRLTELISRVLPCARPVRVVSFDKAPGCNWSVPWHQDRIISVKAKQAVPGFRNWSCKGGTWHCEPPADLLDSMLFVRLHLDDCDDENGALEIALGSHREGVIPAPSAAAAAASLTTEICRARRGDLLVLKMLTLHRSCAAKQPSRRRTFRIDFAPTALPNPLEWTG